jgi:hypothetical protein
MTTDSLDATCIYTLIIVLCNLNLFMKESRTLTKYFHGCYWKNSKAIVFRIFRYSCSQPPLPLELCLRSSPVSCSFFFVRSLQIFSLFDYIVYSSHEGFWWQQRKEKYRMHHVFRSFYMITAFIPRTERKRTIISRIVSFLVNHSNTSHPSSFVTT